MRLLICDDHRLLVDALSMALTQRGYTVVATALDPDGAVAAARIHQPDICLLDVNFRHANGLSAIARIHEVSANTKVIMFSASIDRSLVVEAIALGAQGYVGKEKPVGTIIEALEMAHRGQLAVDPLLLRAAPKPHASEDRRAGQTDRRVGPADRRVGPADRRVGPADRRAGQTDRRAGQTDRRAG
jgi:two-component system nitrate/nitrite response regulator NarL